MFLRNRTIGHVNKQRGLTLLELLAVLAVGAVLLALVYRALFSAEAGANTRAISQQMLQTSQALRIAYPSGNNPNGRYNGLTNTNFIASRQAPQEMVNGTAALRHQDNGNVTCSSTTLSGTANAGASCVWEDVKGVSCAASVGSIKDTMEEITVGTTVVKNASTPYSQSAVNTACNADTVDVTLVQG